MHQRKNRRNGGWKLFNWEVVLLWFVCIPFVWLVIGLFTLTLFHACTQTKQQIRDEMPKILAERR